MAQGCHAERFKGLSFLVELMVARKLAAQAANLVKVLGVSAHGKGVGQLGGRVVARADFLAAAEVRDAAVDAAAPRAFSLSDMGEGTAVVGIECERARKCRLVISVRIDDGPGGYGQCGHIRSRRDPRHSFRPLAGRPFWRTCGVLPAILPCGHPCRRQRHGHHRHVEETVCARMFAETAEDAERRQQRRDEPEGAWEGRAPARP